MVESPAFLAGNGHREAPLSKNRSSSRGPAASAFVALGSLSGGSRAEAPRFDPEAGPPCHDCTARCCKYFALEIDEPKDAEDFDFIRWYLMHEHVVVWKDDGDWYLEIRTRCKNLLPDNRCAVYETRPQICRDYGWPDEDNPEVPCDYFNEGLDYDLFFDDAERFGEWAKTELAKREARRERRRERDRARKARARDASGEQEACA
jgi:Fe-S-cluster containining protein